MTRQHEVTALMRCPRSRGKLAGNAAGAQQSAAEARTVKGAWYVQVTIRTCATGVGLAPAVNSLVTFAAGGTLRESIAGRGFLPGQRSDGHGRGRTREGKPTIAGSAELTKLRVDP